MRWPADAGGFLRHPWRSGRASQKKTLYRLEQGDPGVSWGAVIRVLNILNLLPELNKALNTTNDALGLALMNKAVAKRIRVRKANPDSGAL
ncbi:hypothetical protein [Burkholderia sp. BCC1977]|uniref:hypothetical protein n=1 Tax=Burkholderia sp. BCC1977 TaxID=2817440 RepID=UPI002ABD60C0|nr:hypothetical protein [Burkholderia sp. BCC1977]